jgi:two-component system, OmpR family, sensor histidine kinase MprB
VSLRIRLALVVATTFAVVVVGCVYAAHVSAQRALQRETDRFLAQRSHSPVFTAGAPDHGPRFGDLSSPGQAPPHDGFAFAEPDALVQVLDANGAVIRSFAGQPAIPVDRTDKQLAAQHGPQESPRLRTTRIDGKDYRVLTMSLPNGGAAQIARSIAESNNVLSSLDLRLLLIALAGTVVAAALAWLIARRLTRPVEQLTLTAEHIAQTQDLDQHIEVERGDEIGRLATSFNTMLGALGSSRAQQRRLVVDASHELRTPLTALRTNIELLQRTDALDGGQRAELIAAAQVELAELGDLVAELVDLATDARAEEPLEPADLGEIAARVVDRERRRSGRDITLTRDDPAEVVVRVAAIDRALHNLVDNACKFSPDGTTVEVEVRGSAVAVLDRGVGIADDERAHVFDRFFRATTARSQPGSGLGLSIVAQIAEMHGGTAELLPRPGGGTVARFTLPAGTGAAPYGTIT